MTDQRDLFDVTPQEYATAHGISETTAVGIFKALYRRRLAVPLVIRTGIPTVLYPGGKLYRMSRRYFESTLKMAA